YTDNNYSPCAAAVARESTAAPTAEKGLSVNVYPNPFARMFSVDMAGDEGATFSIEVTTLDGVSIEQRNNLEFNTKHELGDGWGPGIYLMKVRTANGTSIQRLIKRTN
ncbi:MAG TPA: T9SS type A sorting domain-containing protein, partial [Chryseosolibacter sp.]|nr:T9SS type A sorting domain-containing protein [Chryseosolibacter sp.]